MHPSAYLSYAAWLAPVLMPVVLALVWRDRLSRKIPFVVIGVLVGFGVVFLSVLPFGMLLGWLNRLIQIEQWEARSWFNGVLLLAFNIAVSYVAMTFLARFLVKGVSR